MLLWMYVLGLTLSSLRYLTMFRLAFDNNLVAVSGHSIGKRSLLSVLT